MSTTRPLTKLKLSTVKKHIVVDSESDTESDVEVKSTVKKTLVKKPIVKATVKKNTGKNVFSSDVETDTETEKSVDSDVESNKTKKHPVSTNVKTKDIQKKIIKNTIKPTIINHTIIKPTIDKKVLNIFIEGKSLVEELKNVNFDFNLCGGTIRRGRLNANRQVTNEVQILLDGTFSKIGYVPQLRTTLYPHQQTVVSAMLELEQCRVIFQPDPMNQGNFIKITYNAGTLSEPVGSGKTLDILSTIILNPIPRAIPDIMQLQTQTLNKAVSYARCKFKRFLKPTIIFVGTSVMKQWEYAIGVYTKLKMFSVNNVFDLKTLFEMISDKTINSYNIILVKNGTITVPVKLPNDIELEPKNKCQKPYIYNLIANLRDYCWSRVVIDDFDTIKLPHNAGIVRGIFTWYISSTRKRMEYRKGGNTRYETASEAVYNHDYGCANIMYNHLLFKELNVRNNIEYLKSTMQVPNPKYHVAIFKNPNDRYISILASMGDVDVNRVTEMLNGDAIGTAAETIGIKSKSVGDIFKNILGSKFKQYQFSGDLLSFIEHLQETEPLRAPMSENPDPKDKYYGKNRLLEFEEVEYKYPGVNKLIEETEVEYKEIKKVSGTAIERVKGNLKHGSCPVCKTTLEDEKLIIVKCCGTVFCEECGVKAQNLNNRRLQGGRCSNCRATLTIKDLIYLDENIDIEKIIEEDIEEEEAPALTTNEKKTIKKERTKYSAIIDIINGVAIDEDKRVDMVIPNIMKGGCYLKESKVRKVLIFANFDETLTKVVEVLEEENIKYWFLHGGVSEIANYAKAFTEYTGTCAMVINSTKHCSGLNLQTATDLIFAHRMIDSAIESQVVGRGHRIGRKNPLNVWFLTYDNEYTDLSRTHGMREMSADELLHEAKMENGEESATINSVVDNTNASNLGTGVMRNTDNTNIGPTTIGDNIDEESNNNDTPSEDDEEDED